MIADDPTVPGSGPAVPALPGLAAGRQPGAATRPRTLRFLKPVDLTVILAVGFVLQFNPLAATFGLPVLRLSDLMPFLTIPFFLLRHGTLTVMLGRAFPIAIVIGLLAASVLLKSDIEQGDVYLTLVLLMYVVQASQFAILFRDPSGIVWFAGGTLAGFAASLGALAAAAAGIDLTGVGLAVPSDGIDPELVLFMKDKLGGLWFAGNETGHVYALAGAAAAYLWYRTGRGWIYLLYIAGLMLSFPMTNNRAGLIMPLLFLVPVIGRSVRAVHLLSAVGGIAALVMVFGATGFSPLPEQFQAAIEKRFVEDGNAKSNVSERLDSTGGALLLIAAHPFGLGVVSKENQLREMTGTATPHNGIVSLALQSGVFVALAFVVAALRIVAAPERFGPFAFYTVLFMVPSLMFEELTINQVFLFSIAFVLANAALVPRADPGSA